MLDLTLFLASSSDSMAWIGEGFPQPVPHNGTVLRQTSTPGIDGYSVTTDDAEAENLVCHCWHFSLSTACCQQQPHDFTDLQACLRASGIAHYVRDCPC